MASAGRLYFIQYTNTFNSDDSAFDTDFDSARISGMTRDEACLCAMEAMYYGLVAAFEVINSEYSSFSEYRVRLSQNHKLLVKSKVTGSSLESGPHVMDCIHAGSDEDESFRRLVLAALNSQVEGAIELSGTPSVMGRLVATYRAGLAGDFADPFPYAEGIVLPVLKSGSLVHPELVLALLEMDFGVHRAAFENVLFYIHKDDPLLHDSDVTQFRPLRSLSLRLYQDGDVFNLSAVGLGGDYEAIQQGFELAACPGPFLKGPPCYEIDGANLGLEIVSDDIHPNHGAIRAVRMYASELLAFGLGIPDNHILCSAPLDYLSDFEGGSFSAERLVAAKAALSSIDPVESVWIPGLEGESKSASAESTLCSYFGPSALMGLALNEEVTKEITNAFPPHVWKHFCGDKYSGGLYRLFFMERFVQFSEGRVDAKLSIVDLDVLKQSGHRLQSGTDLRIASVGLPVSVVPFVQALTAMCDESLIIEGVKVSLSPGELLGLVTESVLSGLPPVASDSVIEYLVKEHGIASMAKVAVGADHWNCLHVIFGSEPLIDYLPKLPAETRKRIVTSDFNL